MQNKKYSKKNNWLGFFTPAKKTIIAASAFLVCTLTANHAFAQAGFNCAKASNQIEELICANPKLSKQDKDLNILFADLKNKYPEKKQELIKSQKDWIFGERNQVCDGDGDYDCREYISDSYKDRLKKLKKMETDFKKSAKKSEDSEDSEGSEGLNDLNSTTDLPAKNTKKTTNNPKNNSSENSKTDDNQIAKIMKMSSLEAKEKAICKLIDKNPTAVQKFYENKELDIETMPICHDKRVDFLVKEVSLLSTVLRETWGEEHACVGSMKKSYYNDQARNSILMALDPYANVKPEDMLNLEDWGQQSIEQKFMAKKIAEVAEKAKVGLANYYSKKFDLDADEAKKAANTQIQNFISEYALQSAYLNLSFFDWPNFTLKDLERFLQTNVIPTDKLDVISFDGEKHFFTKDEAAVELLKLALSNQYPVEAIKKIIAYPNLQKAVTAYNENQEVNIFRWANYSTEVMALMMGKLKDINTQDRYGKTPLVYAILSKNNQMVDFLIKAGVDLKAGSEQSGNACVQMEAPWGRTPLMYAILASNVHAVEQIMNSSQRVSVVAQDDDGNIARFYLNQNKNLSPTERKKINDLIS